jgi:hypothetical protein
MVQKKSRRIFTDEELYKFCIAEICGMSLEEETGVGSCWADFTEEELERKYNCLSKSGQDAFERQLTKAATKFMTDFNNLRREIDNDEDYMEFEDDKNEIMYKIADELNEFRSI